MKQLLLPLLLLAPAPAIAAEPAIDPHVHLWKGQESIDAYEKQVAETGESVRRFGGVLMATAGDPDKTRAANDALLALARANPRMFPVASVHPYDGEAAIAELRRLAKAGVTVIKLHPHSQKFDVTDPRVLALCTEAGALGIVVMLDNANIIAGDSENLFNLAVQAPRTKFLFTHMGAGNFRFWGIIPLARTTSDFWPDNIWFDISATITLYADSPVEPEFVWTMRQIGTDRIILASDYPQFSFAQSGEALDKLDLTPAERRAIRHDNSAKLLRTGD